MLPAVMFARWLANLSANVSRPGKVQRIVLCGEKVLTYRLDAVKTRKGRLRGDDSTFQLGDCETVMASSIARQTRSRPCPVTAE
jgi:hypothetical protein